MFLEKTKLKDVSSNDADWIRDLRIILIAAQKNYVLDAPLGDRPIAGADAHIMNVWQSSVRWLLNSLVHHALRLKIGASKTFLKRRGAYEMFQELKLVFQTHAHVERYETFDKYFAYKDGGEYFNQWACAQIVWVLQLLASSGC